MSLFITFLTFVLVLVCLVLILLVLIQLPKKEAGMGLAFGAGATDALFGAGSGNVLTKATKYAAAVFCLLVLGIGILNALVIKGKNTSRLGELMKQTPAAAAPAAPAAATPASPVINLTNTPAVTNLIKVLSNAAAAAVTNLTTPAAK